jgi:hypothetical protein
MHSRIHDIRVCDGCLLGDIINAKLVGCIEEELHDHLGPKCPVREETQITERLLRTPKLPFLLAEFVREFNEEFAVAMTLMLGKR